MKYIIDTDICQKEGIKLDELLLALLVKSTSSLSDVYTRCRDEHKIKVIDSKTYITDSFDDKICRCLLLAEPIMPKDTELDKLAEQLMAIFPVGKKEGTSSYWKGNKKDNKLRLQKFFKMYGNKYTSDQIINAAKEYVSSFNGQYAYMRVLKYFIWKDAKKMGADGNNYVEEVSDLASYIENANQENSKINNQEWTVEQR